MNALNIGLLSMAFQAIWLVLALVALAFLIRAYLRTRMSGLIWLLFAIIVWPTVLRLVPLALPMWAASHNMAMNDVAVLNVCVFGVGGLVGIALLVVATVLLDKQLRPVPQMTAQPLPTFPAYPQAQ